MHPEPGEALLKICICSDDPLTFGTALPDELQYLLDALVLVGASQSEAERWIERACRQGLFARFTLPVRPDWIARLAGSWRGPDRRGAKFDDALRGSQQDRTGHLRPPP
ncbi:MAG: hypothetical protein HY744_14275 [Deltaproteobacteria bacterium]|nr:hypothetical protein [Deltaproteobacteria bacterium]